MRLVTELTRVGLDVHAEAAALFGAPAADPVEVGGRRRGAGLWDSPPYLGDGLVERVAERYHRVAEELTAQDVADHRAWRCLGPMMIPNGQTRSDQLGARVDVSGRVAAIAVDPRDPEHILVGAAGGGIWESRDGGGGWSPRSDHAQTLAIGALAFDPHSTTVLAGTGEGNFWSYLGAGVLRSADGDNVDVYAAGRAGGRLRAGAWTAATLLRRRAGLRLLQNSQRLTLNPRRGVPWPGQCAGGDGRLPVARGVSLADEGTPGHGDGFRRPRVRRLAVAFAPWDPSIAYAWGAAGAGAPSLGPPGGQMDPAGPAG